MPSHHQVLIVRAGMMRLCDIFNAHGPKLIQAVGMVNRIIERLEDSAARKKGSKKATKKPSRWKKIFRKSTPK